MRLVSVPVNKEVVSLQAGDFDGDGKADLASTAPRRARDPPQRGRRAGSADVKKINTGDAVEAGALSVGDLDRDGRDDLALLTKDEILLIFQREKGKLGEPERLPTPWATRGWSRPSTSTATASPTWRCSTAATDDPIRVRFATEKGQTRPRGAVLPRAASRLRLRPGRRQARRRASDDREPVGPDPGPALGERRRGRPPRAAELLPAPARRRAGPSLDLATSTATARPTSWLPTPPRPVHRLSPVRRTGLGESKTFPGLVGGGPVKLADLDGDGKAEVYVVSEKEKQLGRSILPDGRLTFPAPLPISGEPVALAVADLDGDKTPEIVYVTYDQANANDGQKTFLPSGPWPGRSRARSSPSAGGRWIASR